MSDKLIEGVVLGFIIVALLWLIGWGAAGIREGEIKHDCMRDGFVYIERVKIECHEVKA